MTEPIPGKPGTLQSAIAQEATRLRLAAGYTVRRRFIEDYGLDEGQLSQFENGNRMPKNLEALVEAYASAAKVTVRDAWGGIVDQLIADRERLRAEAALRQAERAAEDEKKDKRRRRGGR